MEIKLTKFTLAAILIIIFILLKSFVDMLINFLIIAIILIAAVFYEKKYGGKNKCQIKQKDQMQKENF